MGDRAFALSPFFEAAILILNFFATDFTDYYGFSQMEIYFFALSLIY